MMVEPDLKTLQQVLTDMQLQLAELGKQVAVAIENQPKQVNSEFFKREIHRYHSAAAAAMVLYEMDSLGTGVALEVTHSKPSAADANRGVGEYAISGYVPDYANGANTTYRLSAAADVALQRALANELRKYAPRHALCTDIWHLRPDSKLHGYNVMR
jgi:hypothetical protein